MHLKAQIALLQSEIADSKQEIIEEEKNIEYFAEEIEANDSNCSAEHIQFEHSNFKSQSGISKIAPKMAERVKLRCSNKLEHDNITASDLLKNEVSVNF